MYGKRVGKQRVRKRQAPDWFYKPRVHCTHNGKIIPIKNFSIHKYASHRGANIYALRRLISSQKMNNDCYAPWPNSSWGLKYRPEISSQLVNIFLLQYQ